MLVLGLVLGLGDLVCFLESLMKGQNDAKYSKLLIVFITLIAEKLVISQIH